MSISDEELESFANDPENKIELSKCGSNAYKVHKKFNADIYEGWVYSTNDRKEQTKKPHIWNVKKVVSKNGEIEEQLIDIYNYKLGRKFEYYGHHNPSKVCIETFPKYYKIDR